MISGSSSAARWLSSSSMALTIHRRWRGPSRTWPRRRVHLGNLDRHTLRHGLSGDGRRGELGCLGDHIVHGVRHVVAARLGRSAATLRSTLRHGRGNCSAGMSTGLRYHAAFAVFLSKTAVRTTGHAGSAPVSVLAVPTSTTGTYQRSSTSNGMSRRSHWSKMNKNTEAIEFLTPPRTRCP